MKYKKSVIASAVALAVIGSIFAYRAHEPSSTARNQAPRGIVNPDYPTSDMTTEPMPELSSQRIQPRESLGEGSYTARIPAKNIDENTDKKVR